MAVPLVPEDLDAMDAAANEVEAQGAVEGRVPPHDLEAEGAVLSAVMVDPSALAKVSEFLRPEHFFAEAHRRIFEACLGLAADDRPVDVVQVATWLRDHDRLAQVGGMAYLTEVLNAAPAVANVTAYGKTIHEKWRVWQLILTCQRVTSQGYAGYGDADAFVSGALAQMAPLARGPGEDRVPSGPADVVRRWAGEGPVVHAPTGLPTLDEATGGGFGVPRRVVVIGAPSSGKTALVTTFGRRYATAGAYFVGIHAIDEDDDDLTVRLAQMAGYTIAQCEGRAAELLAEIATALSRLPVAFYDMRWTIEEATADLARRAQRMGAAAVYIADSAQTVRSRGALEAKSPREVVDANMRAIRQATSAHRLLSLVTSEANRRSYQSEDAAEQANDLAAGAESRAIEFSAQTLIMLRTPKGHPDHVHATVPKNRRGRAGFEFYLRLDRDRHALTECADPSADPDEAKHRADAGRAKNRRAVEADAHELASLVRLNPGMGERALRAALKVAGHRWGVVRLDAARTALEGGVHGVRLVNKGSPKRPAYQLEQTEQGGNE